MLRELANIRNLIPAIIRAAAHFEEKQDTTPASEFLRDAWGGVDTPTRN